MQDQLVRLIMRILVKNPEFYYYQGYHDICVTFLLVLGEEMAFYVVNKLSTTHLRAFMEKTMDKASDLLNIIPLIVKSEDKVLGEYMERSQVGDIYALSWVITWFSHVVKSYEIVGRLFDFFIASHELMPIYLTVAIVLHKRMQILDLECDMAMMHQYLTRITDEDDLPIEALILEARKLIISYPPHEMKKIQQIEKEKRLKEESLFRKRRGIVKRRFGFNMILNTFTRRKVFSVAAFVVVVATLYQYYWNNEKISENI